MKSFISLYAGSAGEGAAAEIAEAADRWLGWSERWPLLIPVSLICGISTYYGLSMEPAADSVAWAAAGLLIALALVRFAIGHAVWPVLAACFVLGFVLAKTNADGADSAMIEASTGAIIVEGTVSDIERSTDRTRIRLDDTMILGVSRSIRLRLDQADRRIPAIGDRIAVRALVFPPPGPALPGAYDFRRKSYFDGLDGTGVALAPMTVVAEDRGRSVLEWAANARRKIRTRINASIDQPAASIAVALLTGDRSGMPAVIYDQLRDAGLAHLLAISGLHVGLVAGFFLAGTRLAVALWPYAADRWDGKKISAVAGIIAAFCYTAAVGATVPTQRAFIMTALALLAVLLDRWPLSMRLVAVAATAVMTIAPSSVIGPGFQMSFAAVIALIATYEAMTRDGVRRLLSEGTGTLHRTVQYAGGVLLTSVIAGLATAPFAIFHFQHLASYGLVSNLVAVPLTAFWIMPAGIVSLAAMTVGLEGPPLKVMAVGVDLLLAVAKQAAEWPSAAVTVPKPDVPTIGIVAAAGIWLALFRGPGRLLALGPLALGVSVMATTPPIAVFVDARDGTIGVVLTSRNQSTQSRGDRTLWLSDARMSDYTRELWRRWGLVSRTHLLPLAGSATNPDQRRLRNDNLNCDAEGCILRLGDEGPTVAVALTRRAVSEDCAVVDILLTRMTVSPPPPHCGRTPIIDRSYLDSEGSVSVTVHGSSLDIRTVRGHTGARPWSQWHRDPP